MSRLGDLIVEHGPYGGQGNLPQAVWDALDEDTDLNALRDELIELRAFRDPLVRVPRSFRPTVRGNPCESAQPWVCTPEDCPGCFNQHCWADGGPTCDCPVQPQPGAKP